MLLEPELWNEYHYSTSKIGLMRVQVAVTQTVRTRGPQAAIVRPCTSELLNRSPLVKNFQFT
jgi:hypothetical protein